MDGGRSSVDDGRRAAKTGAKAFSDAGDGRRNATGTEGGSGPAAPAIDPRDGDGADGKIEFYSSPLPSSGKGRFNSAADRLFLSTSQAFLPGSVVDKSSDSLRGLRGLEVSGDLGHLKEMGLLDFGEGIRFVPSKLLEKFRREAIEANRSAASSRPGIRAALRKPQLALVLADLSVDAVQSQITSIAMSLQEIGYSIQSQANKD
ncbi:hypothetical protein MRB53_006287 [Persea americana]|uniref:Uncharacterized protein n=1 Tax=Persea americana TaxID=3435 RepID=A0ACC2MFY8_PERAE|nr:hypothetical protein MRB53_006287 [Persea americana]